MSPTAQTAPSGFTIQVGAPWPGPTGDGLIWHPETGLLTLFVNGRPLAEAERDALGGPIDIAVLGSRDVIGIALRLGCMGWQDSYSGMPAGGLPEHFRDEWNRDTRQALDFVAIENRIVVSQRAMTMSPHASRSLRREAMTRWKPLSDGAFRQQVAAIFATYPTTRKAVNSLTIARCKAGQ